MTDYKRQYTLTLVAQRCMGSVGLVAMSLQYSRVLFGSGTRHLYLNDVILNSFILSMIEI